MNKEAILTLILQLRRDLKMLEKDLNTLEREVKGPSLFKDTLYDDVIAYYNSTPYHEYDLDMPGFYNGKDEDLTGG